ncbi:hypothetical protein GCM10009557_33180 [Virgisporangium ochraceum]
MPSVRLAAAYGPFTELAVAARPAARLGPPAAEAVPAVSTVVATSATPASVIVASAPASLPGLLFIASSAVVGGAADAATTRPARPDGREGAGR